MRATFALALVLGSALVAGAQPASDSRAVELQVTDRLGRVIDTATACLVNTDGCTPLAIEDSEGRRIARVPRAGDLTVRIAALGFIGSEALVPNGSDVSLHVVLGSQGGISVKLISEADRKESTVDATLARLDEKEPSGRPIETKRFFVPASPDSIVAMFTDLPVGRYLLSWSGPGVASGDRTISVDNPALADAGTVTLVAGDAAGKPRTDFVNRGADTGPRPTTRVPLRGRVVLADTGAPAAGATVTVWVSTGDRTLVPFTARAGKDGRWEVKAIPADGSVHIAADATGLTSRLLKYDAAPTEDVEVKLSKGGRIEGTVCGTPEFRLYNAISALPADGIRGTRQASLDENGRFTFPALAPGLWTLARERHEVSFDTSGKRNVATEETLKANVEEGGTTTVSFSCPSAPGS